jgi:hypothetical protein
MEESDLLRMGISAPRVRKETKSTHRFDKLIRVYTFEMIALARRLNRRAIREASIVANQEPLCCALYFRIGCEWMQSSYCDREQEGSKGGSVESGSAALGRCQCSSHNNGLKFKLYPRT